MRKDFDLVRLAMLAVAATSTIVVTGCQNRCANCRPGLFANSTIAAPPTYSLNIPSQANNQPYYVPGGGTRTADGSLNTSASGSTNPDGWRPVDGNTLDTRNGSSQSVLTAPTTFVGNQPTAPTQFRMASNSQMVAGTATPESGLSYTDSRNYQTTRVDESRDQSRLPVTDASTVRAPAQNYPVGGTRIAQIPRPGGTTYPPSFNVAASTAQPVYAGQLNYQGNPMVSNPYGNNPVYVGQPTVAPGFVGTPVIAGQPAVLASSTVNYDANANAQTSWRNREIGSDSFSR